MNFLQNQTLHCTLGQNLLRKPEPYLSEGGRWEGSILGADCYVGRRVCKREERGELVSRLVKFPSLFVANSGEFSEPWLWLAET